MGRGHRQAALNTAELPGGTSPPFQEMLGGDQDRTAQRREQGPGAGGPLRSRRSHTSLRQSLQHGAHRSAQDRLLPGGTTRVATNALLPPGSAESTPPGDGQSGLWSRSALAGRAAQGLTSTASATAGAAQPPAQGPLQAALLSKPHAAALPHGQAGL